MKNDKRSVWPKNCFTCKHRFLGCKTKFKVKICDEFEYGEIVNNETE